MQEELNHPKIKKLIKDVANIDTSDKPKFKEELKKILEQFGDYGYHDSSYGDCITCKKVAEAQSQITELFNKELDKVRDREWLLIHTKHEVGTVVGNYKITERFRRVGKNTKYKVVCTLCGQPMFRYSNKFKLPHRDCPAVLRRKIME